MDFRQPAEPAPHLQRRRCRATKVKAATAVCWAHQENEDVDTHASVTPTHRKGCGGLRGEAACTRGDAAALDLEGT